MFQMSYCCFNIEHNCSQDTLSSSCPALERNSYQNWDSQTQADVWSCVLVWPLTILEDKRNRRTGFPKVMTLSMSRCIFLCVHQLTSASHDATWQVEEAHNRHRNVAE